MKKRIILAAFLVAALIFGTISCKKESKDDGLKQCWKVTLIAEQEGDTVEATSYVWATEEYVDNIIPNLIADAEERMPEAIVIVFKAAAPEYTTKADCESLDNKQ